MPSDRSRSPDAAPYCIPDPDSKNDNPHVVHEEYSPSRNVSDQPEGDTFADASFPKKSAWQSMKENRKAVGIAFAMQASTLCPSHYEPILTLVQLGGMIIGLELIVVATLVANQAFVRVMGSGIPVDGRYTMPAWLLSLWSGVYQVTQLFGMATAGWLTDKIGRRAVLWLLPCAIITGALIEVNSPNRYVFLAGKIVMGGAAGFVTVIPTYVSEIAPRECRGILINFFGFFMQTGLVIGTGVTYAGNTAYPGAFDERSWKMPIWCGVALPCVMGICNLFLLRESPLWLVMRNRHEDAKKSLRFIFPKRNEADIDLLLADVIHNLEVEQELAALSRQVSYMECLKGTDLRRTCIAIFPTVSLAMSGYFLQSSYSTYFFELTGFDNSVLGSVIVSLFGLAGCIATFFLVEVVGRRRLVIGTTTFQTVCMLVIGMVNSIQHGNISVGGGWVLVIALALYNVAAGNGAGGVYTAEAGSTRLRAKTIAIALGVQALINAVWQVVLPYELDAIGPTTGYMFFGFGTICSVIIYFFIPELAGLSYAQIDERFARGIPARKFHSYQDGGDTLDKIMP